MKSKEGGEQRIRLRWVEIAKLVKVEAEYICVRYGFREFAKKHRISKITFAA
jgi:hypothetical protein